MQAASRWTHVITTGLEDVETAGLRPISPTCPYPAMVDDILVCITFEPIDGPGGVLAAAGPDSFRIDNGLPVAGPVIVDTADIPALKSTSSDFLDTITHEMGHVLGEDQLNEIPCVKVASGLTLASTMSFPGVGTIWIEQGVQSTAAGCPYSGPNAIREYGAISGCDFVPIEQTGGPGTACGHWDETCLGIELMTGFSNPEVSNPLSKVTVGSLEDVGYTVDYFGAEPFGTENVAPQCLCNGRRARRGLGHSGPRRHLSDEMRQYAIEYGQEFMADRWSSLGEVSSETVRVGGEMVFVLVQDGDEKYDVAVTKNDAP
jgi:Leishmanolysin